MDALVSRIYSIQNEVGHEKVTPDARVTTFLWSAMGATLADTEVAARDSPVLIPLGDNQVATLLKTLFRSGLAHRRSYFSDSGDWTKQTIITRSKQLDRLRQILAGKL